jgi:hypothetical protein
VNSRRLFQRVTALAIATAALTSVPGWVNRAEAYPTYNRLGYISCTACHFLPTGGGLLTPYGKSIGATMAWASQDIEPQEQVFNQGAYVRTIVTDSNQRANPFLMQADYLASAFVRQNIRADLQIGPNLQRGPHGSFASIPDGSDSIVVRRGLVTGQINDESAVQVGRDLEISGLNIEDHTTFLRSRNKRSVLDYPTQFRYIYQSDQIQLLPYLMIPSYEEDADNQEYGGGFRTEYALNNSNSVGLTGLLGNTASIQRLVGSAYARLSQAHWNGFQTEFVYTHRNIHSDQSSFDQWDVFAKPYVAIPDWIETGFVYEFLHGTDPFYENSFQYGPSVNIRIHQYFSILGDGRNIGLLGNANWSWYGQAYLHVQI